MIRIWCGSNGTFASVSDAWVDTRQRREKKPINFTVGKPFCSFVGWFGREIKINKNRQA